MKIVPVTLKGVNVELRSGDMHITRRVIDRPSLLVKADGYSNSMEIACQIPSGHHKGFFFFPSGEKEDKTEFFKFVVMVDADLVEYVQAACQPRYLYEEGKDLDRVPDEVKEMMTASGIVIAKDLP